MFSKILKPRAGNPCRKFVYTLCWAVTLLLGTFNRCAEESLPGREPLQEVRIHFSRAVNLLLGTVSRCAEDSPPGSATLLQVNLTFSRKRNSLNLQRNVSRNSVISSK